MIERVAASACSCCPALASASTTCAKTSGCRSGLVMERVAASACSATLAACPCCPAPASTRATRASPSARRSGLGMKRTSASACPATLVACRSLAVNEHVVAADLLGERTAGAENHGDALMVGGGWRPKLARDCEQPAASVVQRHLQLGLAAEQVLGQSLRGGAAVTDEAADAGHGEAAGGRLPPAGEREGSAAVREVARARLQLAAPAQGEHGTIGRHGGIRRPWRHRPDHPRVRRVVVGRPAGESGSRAHRQSARDHDGDNEQSLHWFPLRRRPGTRRCEVPSAGKYPTGDGLLRRRSLVKSRSAPAPLGLVCTRRRLKSSSTVDRRVLRCSNGLRCPAGHPCRGRRHFMTVKLKFAAPTGPGNQPVDCLSFTMAVVAARLTLQARSYESFTMPFVKTLTETSRMLALSPGRAKEFPSPTMTRCMFTSSTSTRLLRNRDSTNVPWPQVNRSRPGCSLSLAISDTASPRTIVVLFHSAASSVEEKTNFSISFSRSAQGWTPASGGQFGEMASYVRLPSTIPSQRSTRPSPSRR